MDNIHSLIQRGMNVSSMIMPEDLRQQEQVQEETTTLPSTSSRSYRRNIVFQQKLTKNKFHNKQKHKQEMYGLFIKRMQSNNTQVKNYHKFGKQFLT